MTTKTKIISAVVGLATIAGTVVALLPNNATVSSTTAKINAANARKQTVLDSQTYATPAAKKSVDSIESLYAGQEVNAIGKVNFNAAPSPVANPGNAGTHAPINLSGISNQTITGWHISGGGVPCITLKNCSNVHITMCKLDNTTSSAGSVSLSGCSNVTIDYNFMTNVSTGVYAVGCTGGIKVDNNQFLNMMGKYPRGQASQFNNCSGAGNNKIENIMGKSYPEDVINFYHSSGTAASPILCNSNWIRGGGPSTTSGAINLGDNGGAYESASNNIIVDGGQYGMAISGGSNMSLINNQIYGKQQSFTNVGIVVWSQQGDQPSIPYISNATVSGNRVWFFSGRSQYIGLNPYWIGDKGLVVAGLSTNLWNDKTVTAAILPATIITYQ